MPVPDVGARNLKPKEANIIANVHRTSDSSQSGRLLDIEHQKHLDNLLNTLSVFTQCIE